MQKPDQNKSSFDDNSAIQKETQKRKRKKNNNNKDKQIKMKLKEKSKKKNKKLLQQSEISFLQNSEMMKEKLLNQIKKLKKN